MSSPLNSPKIIGFCGYPGSGKDEAAKVLVARGWQRIAFADKLREMALAIDPMVAPEVEFDGADLSRLDFAKSLSAVEFHNGDSSVTVRKPAMVKMTRLSVYIEKQGWDAAKRIPEVRRLLQRIGTEAVRDIIGPDTWVQIAERSIEVGKRVVFTDVRFANEAEMIRSRGGLICRVWRNESTDKFRESQHSSEQYPFESDRAITNDGTLAELENSVLELAGYSL